jgi:hypothetical protein
MIIKDKNLQIFLTLYYGSMASTFFYDYIIRNMVRLIQDRIRWNYIVNTGIGILFLAITFWLISSLLAKIRTNLLMSMILLILMLVVRCALGIPEFYGFVFLFFNKLT